MGRKLTWDLMLFLMILGHSLSHHIVVTSAHYIVKYEVCFDSASFGLQTSDTWLTQVTYSRTSRNA